MIKYYIINGHAGAGKDTFVWLCQNQAGNKAIINISTVDFVKQIATLCGWTGEKDEKNRRFLSDLKDLLTKWNDVPFRDLLKRIERYKENSLDADLTFFIHCREPEEIERLRDFLGAKTIFIKRDTMPQIISNHADKNVENFEYDIYIENNGTIEELSEKARQFLTEEEKEKDEN